ncbi:hypothetical protein PLCT2_00955 [Planctomycetaceae bacterium]|nr:hypothetical protein PLCT2_00955 [Planctomycetaceae bacterium]
MEWLDTHFEQWQIRVDSNLIGTGVALVWQTAFRHDRACLVVQLQAGEARCLAEVAIFAGGQTELTTQIPLTIYADPRASILSLELASLFIVCDGRLNVEPG